jgi:hypothetical protein
MQQILFPSYVRNLEITLQYVLLATLWDIQMQYLLKMIWCILKKRYCSNEAFRESHPHIILAAYTVSEHMGMSCFILQCNETPNAKCI